MTGLTQQFFQRRIDAGFGEEDMCSTIKPLEAACWSRSRKRSF